MILTSVLRDIFRGKAIPAGEPTESAPRIEIVSATRLSQDEFSTKSALGASLRRFERDPRLSAHITCANQRGLPEIFNERILAPGGPEVLVFIHDDVWIDDSFFADRVIDGLERFDVIGVAGNRRRVRNQPAWCFVNTDMTWDDARNLSGRVAHGNGPFGAISMYGPVPAECELLDGAFLAAKRSTLARSKLLFDPQFDFHLYDMDFCRSARMQGLRLGTWPICLTHQSVGAFGAPHWAEKYQRYVEKWDA